MMPRTEAADAGILASRLLHANPAGRRGYIFPCCHSVAWGQAGVKPRPCRVARRINEACCVVHVVQEDLVMISPLRFKQREVTMREKGLRERSVNDLRWEELVTGSEAKTGGGDLSRGDAGPLLDGRGRRVRHGHGPKRTIQTGRRSLTDSSPKSGIAHRISYRASMEFSIQSVNH
jgi:hypothetical protein